MFVSIQLIFSMFGDKGSFYLEGNIQSYGQEVHNWS